MQGCSHDITANPLELARRFVEDTGINLFLTGKAGTGKTTFLRSLCASSRKRIVVAAPTGIAAINAGGITLHSLFQLPFGAYLPGVTVNNRYDRFSRAKLRLIRAMDLLVIDEVSMVRADLLDAVDAALRRHRDHDRPFGGVQLLLIGDLGQLAPVVTEAEQPLLSQYYASPYFFESKALQQAGYRIVELTEVFRQSDPRFVDLLNRVRDNSADNTVLRVLNARCIPGFKPPRDAGYIRLTTHNHLARAVNDRELDALPGDITQYNAHITGEFPESALPAERNLQLKVGAQVMFVKNDTETPRRFYNGMIGRVVDMQGDMVRVQPADRMLPQITVAPMQWENSVYALNDKTGELEQKVVGTFRQIPLRTAWAITIHKSQGLTFDHAIIDAAAAFAHGQTYVALSRCRSLEGLVLERPLTASTIIADSTLADYDRRSRDARPDASDLELCKRAYRLTLLNDMFGFTLLGRALNDTYRRVSDAFGTLFPTLVRRYRDMDMTFNLDFTAVGQRFAMQYTPMAREADAALDSRVNAAARYFADRLQPLQQLVRDTPREHDNKETLRRLIAALDNLTLEVAVKAELMRQFSDSCFTVDLYLRTKSDAQLAFDADLQATATSKTKAKTARTPRTGASKVREVADVTNPKLYNALMQWRRDLMEEQHRPAFTILSNRAIIALAESAPRTLGELRDIPGIGPAKISVYGPVLLSIIAAHAD